MKWYRVKYYLTALYRDMLLGILDYRIRRCKTRIAFMEIYEAAEEALKEIKINNLIVEAQNERR